jgi:putative transposase
LLREATRAVRVKHPFEIIAIVILPDHIHAVWELPAGDADYALRWRLIKTSFTKALNMIHQDAASKSVWQSRYWEHTIRDDLDLQRHVDYIHWNPVKHGYATRPVDWLYSSIHRYLRDGLLSADWGEYDEAGTFGE